MAFLQQVASENGFKQVSPNLIPVSDSLIESTFSLNMKPVSLQIKTGFS